ncbi:MAG: ABC transporter permease [Candidatus Methanomethylophilaceae archaeon]|nr:ABC transporter permease [Candidatus Methanomethylophilaceae archaeon]
MLITILVLPLLYFISFAYGLGSTVDNTDGVTYIAFVIPGIVSLSTLSSCFSTTANKIMLQRRFYSSFDEVTLCPVSSSSIVLGKTILGIIRGLLCAAILMILGLLMTDDFSVTLMLLFTVFVSCLTYSLLGVVAGFMVKGPPTFNLFNSLVILPMTFLCGTVFSVSMMPEFLQKIIWFLPLTHTTECIRSAALGWEFPWVSLLIVLIYGTVFFLISRYLLEKGKV